MSLNESINKTEILKTNLNKIKSQINEAVVGGYQQ